MEPISPELALIDPELARRALARLPDPVVVRRRNARPRAAGATRAESAPKRLVLLALCLSLGINGVAVARFLTEPQVRGTATSAAYKPTAPAAVEQRLLALVVRRPSAYLPRRLLDTSSGLPKRNLQAVCRQAAGDALSCDVGLPGQHSGVRVLYRRGLGFMWRRPAGG